MASFNPIFKIEAFHIINTVPIFTGIGTQEQRRLADKCQFIERNADEIIIEQGAMADRLYLIIKGKVIVSVKNKSSGWKRINILGPGDVFGEIAIVRNILRTARITTILPSQFLTINDKDFLEAYQYFPAKARDNIQLVIAKRLRESMAYAQ